MNDTILRSKMFLVLPAKLSGEYSGRAVPEEPVAVTPDEPDQLGRLLGPVVLRIDDGLVPLDQPAGSAQHVGLHALHVDLDEVQPGLVVEVVQPHHGDPVLRPRVVPGPGNRVEGDAAEVALARVVDVGEPEGSVLGPDPQMVGMDVGQAVERHVRGEHLRHQPLRFEGEHPSPLADQPAKASVCVPMLAPTSTT